MRVYVLALLAALTTTGPAAARPGDDTRPPRQPLMRATPGAGITVRGAGAGLAARETAGPDTFVLYGGPEALAEGRFQLADGTTPDWGDGTGLPGGIYGGGAAAWWPVDLTDDPVHWHQDTFYAENLNDRGAGNHSYWCGEPAGVPATIGWIGAPGYGSSWDDRIVFESPPVSDPAQGQVVGLDFFFNIDVSDLDWDFFWVEYDSAGTWKRVLFLSRSDYDANLGAFPAPGSQYSTEGAGPIFYSGNDYGGAGGDRIRIRLRVTSDGAWDDSDGFGPTVAGLVQVDDVTITTLDGVFTEDFEGPGPYLFTPEPEPIAGDFADLYPGFTDIDPCRDHGSPVAGFVDYGQVLRNGPGASGATSTGGSVSPGVNYGIAGSYVVNHSGGLDGAPLAVRNEIWSPEILWDLPGTDDDAADICGSFLRFSVWHDLPPDNGIFYGWRVRYLTTSGFYSNWQPYTYLLSGRGAYWSTEQFDTTSRVGRAAYPPVKVQLALGVYDYADYFGLPGTGATPSPVFDDVTFAKYRLAGPMIEAGTVDLAQDGFPVNGSIDVTSATARDALDVPFDMARDANTGSFALVPGDSIAFDVVARIPGARIDDVRMVWSLRTNPLFEDALRSAPARAVDENVVAGPAGTTWSGEVVAQQDYYTGRYWVDLPDQDFLYPGDVLHYYFRAADAGGRVTTLPVDTSGFGVFGAGASYPRRFTVHALPSVMDAAGVQPEVLVIDESGRDEVDLGVYAAFDGVEYVQGVDYDVYTVQGPSSMVSNGIGSAGGHGATVAQLTGYHDILYFSGDLSTGLLSNGLNTGGDDKGDDLGVLTAWHQLAGGRDAAYFGDYVVSAHTGTSEGLAFVADVLGVEPVDHGLADYLGGQVSPEATPSGYPAQLFNTDFVVAGCPGPQSADVIRAGPWATPAHWFRDALGNPMTDPQDPVASVVAPTAAGMAVTFPFSFASIIDPGDPYLVPARSWLLVEVLFYLFGHDQGACVGGSAGTYPFCTDAPATRAPVSLAVFPNPFNPVTTVEFTATIGATGSVRVYNLRGELVRTLHTGEFRQQRFEWDGTDDRGAAVASGVYVVRAEDGRTRKTSKVALVK